MEFVDSVVETKATVAKTFIGHKERAFDVRYSASDQRLLSGSEDGTSKIWDVKTGRCLQTLIHNKETEVLRATFLASGATRVCSCGSDGNAVLWTALQDTDALQRAHVFEHGKDAQIYVCEVSCQVQSNLLVAAENFMVVWDVNSLQQASLHTFGDIDDSGPSFGGHRNPDNSVFVFDGKMNPVDNSIVGVALSDSSIRMLDLRCSPGQSISPFLTKPVSNQIANIGHATSLNWSADASSIAVSFGSGQIAILDTRMQQIRAVLRKHAGACYGSMLIQDGTTCVSWSSDCTIRTWDASTAQGFVDTPLTVARIPEFPVLSAAWDASSGTLYCGGGGGAVGGAATATGKGGRGFSFIGTPIHAINVKLF